MPAVAQASMWQQIAPVVGSACAELVAWCFLDNRWPSGQQGSRASCPGREETLVGRRWRPPADVVQRLSGDLAGLIACDGFGG